MLRFKINNLSKIVNRFASFNPLIQYIMAESYCLLLNKN